MSFKNIVKNVSIVRIGLVLSKDGGVLKQTMQPMSFGFGVYFGKGNQWQSWIHIKDISRLFYTLMKRLYLVSTMVLLLHHYQILISQKWFLE